MADVVDAAQLIEQEYLARSIAAARQPVATGAPCREPHPRIPRRW